MNTSLMKKLDEIKEKFASLSPKYQSQAKVVGFGHSPQTINTICEVCNLGVGALKEGRYNEIADGLKRLVTDAISDTGFIATILNTEGVRLYTQYLNELSELADQISGGKKKAP